MKRALFFLPLLWISCADVQSSGSSKNQKDSLVITSGEIAFDSAKYHLSATKKVSYKQALERLEARRATWKANYRVADKKRRSGILDSASAELEHTLINKVFPFWYGTEWDFNGTSNTPGQGQIACGYFVSTTLKHCGLNVNRYRLAQQASAKTCRILAQGNGVRRYCPKSPEAMADSMVARKSGLYVVGLDYHVGFLLIREQEAFFIHSTFIGTEGVILEKAKDSPAFRSQCYVIAELTGNRRFIKAWLLGEKIRVI